MDQSIIPHVFASLLSLERQVERISRLCKESGSERGDGARRTLPEQRRVVEHMRRVANTLQLSIASKDIPTAVRSLRIFYGLNHMVRPEISASLLALAQPTLAGHPVEGPVRNAFEPSQLH